MAAAGKHMDAWGRTTDGCEAIHDLGRTTYTLCSKPKVAIGVYGDGVERYLCKAHVAGALRKRTFYSNEIVELRTLDGTTTHKLERTSGRKGYMRAASDTMKLDTDPIFASEAQETFTPGSRVYLIADVPVCKAGGEGVYAGHLRERLAVIDLDTPSGEPYRISVGFDLVRNLYR